jgi:hypothetical protein
VVALTPLDRVAVTARVGLPRESRISSASSLRMSGMAHAFPARRSSKASGSPRCFCARERYSRHSAAKQNALITQFCLGNLGGHTAPRQDSLSGVIICPSGWRISGWAAVKGELLHHLLSLCKTWLLGLSTKPCKIKHPRGPRRSAIPQKNAKAVAFSTLDKRQVPAGRFKFTQFVSVMKSTLTAPRLMTPTDRRSLAMGKCLGSHSERLSKCVHPVRLSCYASERGRGLR